MEGQPAKICKSATGPKLVAQYYSAAKSVFKGRKIVAIDILDGFNVGGAVSYLRKFKKYVKGTPKYWGIHNYSDTNRGSTSRTSRLIKEINNKKAEIWLTETGGQLKLRGVVAGETKAANALKCMFSMPKKFKQIKRLYIYQFNGADSSNDFDAGLISPDNTRRGPATTVVKKRTVGHLPRLGAPSSQQSVATGAPGRPSCVGGAGGRDRRLGACPPSAATTGSSRTARSAPRRSRSPARRARSRGGPRGLPARPPCARRASPSRPG